VRSLTIVRSEEPSVHVVVEDIADPSIAAQAEREITTAFSESGATGSWVVAVVASDTRGRWDVGVRGPRGSHFFSFAASPTQVPEFVRRYITRTLSQLHRR
jgi:hypothetical protein